MRSEMKKRFLSLGVVIVLAIAIVFSISSCGINTCMHIDDTETVIEPTCTEGGYTQHVCKTCGYEFTSNETPPIEHNWGEGQLTVAPTVDADGIMTFTCLDCGKIRTETVSISGDTHFHSWDSGVVTTEPTCTEGGVKTFSCSCGEVREEPVDKKGHSYADTVTPPTCTAQGYTTHICSDCEDTVVDSYVAATGHGAYTTQIVAATCESKGYTRHTCGSCPYYYDDTVTVALGHSWSAPTAVTPASCIAQGVNSYSCTRGECQATKTEPSAKIGHTYDSGTVTPATCTEHGYTTYSCTVNGCNDSYTASYTSLVAHSVAAVGEVITPATCTVNGVERFCCANCSYHEDREIQATGHDTEGNQPERQEASTFSSGCTVTVIYVTKCNHQGCEGIIQATEETLHQYKKQLISEGDCHTHPTYKNVCTVCGDGADAAPVEDTSAYGSHKWDGGQQIDTKTVYTCTVGGCDETKSVVKTDGVSGNFDEDALASTGGVVEIGGSDATIDFGSDNIGQIKDQTIKVETIDKDDSSLGLTTEQKDKIGNNKVYDFGVGDSESVIFENGSVTVTVPYELADDEDPDNVAVWYVKGNGEVDKIPAKYSNGYATFETDHFSYYTVIRYTPEEYCAEFGHRFLPPTTFMETCTTGRYTLTKCEKCGVVERVDDLTHPAKGHSYKDTVVPATCTEAGYTLHQCTRVAQGERCTDYYKDNYTELAPHDFKLVATKASTCNERGYKSYKCSCGATKTETIEEYGEHRYGNAVVVTAPTCTSDGVSAKECSVCHDIQTIATAALGHNYEPDVVAPTCTADGYTLHTCSQCSDSYKDSPTDKIPHTYGAALNAPCTACGATCDHTFGKDTYNNDATCTENGTKSHTCTQCARGETVTAENTALGHSFINSVCSVCGTACTHSFGEFVYDNNATCTADGTKSHSCAVCGKVESQSVPGTAFGHKYGSDSVCTVCGDGCTHSFGEFVSDNNATCTSDGTETRKCSKCQKTETQTEDGSKKAHPFGDYKNNNDATCEKNETKTRECTVCGEKQTEEIENSKAAHIYGSDSICTVCGDGCEHAWGDFTDDNNATCTADGTKTRVCGKCNAKDSQNIPDSAKGHDYNDEFKCEICSTPCPHSFGDYVSDGNATCTADGTESRTCLDCGKVESRTETGSMTQHLYGEYVSNGDATCGADGTKTRVCSACGDRDTVTDEGTALAHEYENYVCKHCGTPCAHKWGEFVSNNDATCLADGTKTRTCEYCSKEETKTEEGTMKDHSYDSGACGSCGAVCDHDELGDWNVTSNATCTSNAIESAVCNECGTVMNREIEGSKTRHSYKDGVCEVCGVEESSLFYTNLLLGALSNKYMFVINDLSEASMNSMYGGYQSRFGDSKIVVGIDDNGELIAYGTIVMISGAKEESSVITVIEFAVEDGMFGGTQTIYTAGRGTAVATDSVKMTVDELFINNLRIPNDAFMGMLSLIATIRDEAYANIVAAKDGADSALVEEVCRTVVEFFFTLEESEEGYELSFRTECFEELWSAIADKTAAEMFDGIFGEDAYIQFIEYLNSVNDMSLSAFVDSVKEAAKKFGVNIETIYPFVENMLPPDENGEPTTVEDFLENYGEMTVGEFVEGVSGGKVSYTQAISQIDQMASSTDMFSLVLGVLTAQDISSQKAYIKQQFKQLFDAVSISFDLDSEGNFTAVKLGFDYCMLYTGSTSYGDYAEEYAIYLDMSIQANKEYAFDVTEFLNGIEDSDSIDDVPGTITVPTDTNTFGGANLAVSPDGKITLNTFGDNGDSILISREEIVGPSYDVEMDKTETDVNGKPYSYGKEEPKDEPKDDGKEEPKEESDYVYKHYLEKWVCFDVALISDVFSLDYKACGDWYCYTAEAEVYQYYTMTVTVREVYDENGNLIERNEYDWNYSNYVNDGTFHIYYNATTYEISFVDRICSLTRQEQLDATHGTGCGSVIERCYQCINCGEYSYNTSYKSHDIVAHATLVEGGNTCEDGVIVYFSCKDCGEVCYTFKNVIKEHIVVNTEEIQPYVDSYAKIYIRSCSCGETVSVSSEGFGQYISKTETDENGVEHQYNVYMSYAYSATGMPYIYAEDIYYVLNEEECKTYKHSDYYFNVIMDDSQQYSYDKSVKTISDIYETHDEVVEVTKAESGTNADGFEYELNEYAISCERCDDVKLYKEMLVYDFEERVIVEEYTLTDSEGGIIEYSCVKYSYQFAEPVEVYREQRTKDNWVRMTYRYNSFCEYTAYVEYLDSEGNVINSGNMGSAGHNYMEVYTLADGADDCTEGVELNYICERCGEMDSHGKTEVFYDHIEISAKKNYEDIEFFISSCLCGKNGCYVDFYANIVSEDNGCDEVDGIKHDYYYWYLDGERYRYVLKDEYTYTDADNKCVMYFVTRYVVVEGGVEVYEVASVVMQKETHDLRNSKSNEESVDKDGNFVYTSIESATCRNGCGYTVESRHSEIYSDIQMLGHVGSIQESIECGVRVDYSEVRFIYDEFGTSYRSYTKNLRSGNIVVTEYSYDFASCYYTSYTRVYDANGEIVDEHDGKGGDCHNFKIRYELKDGSVSCYDGVTGYEYCTRCHIEFEDKYFNHHEMCVEEVVDTEMTDCGEAQLVVYRCVCGEFKKYDLKSVCQLEYVEWVDVNGKGIEVYRCPVSACGFTCTREEVWGEKDEYCYHTCDIIYRFGYMMPESKDVNGKEELDLSCYIDDSLAVFKIVLEDRMGSYNHRNEYTTGTYADTGLRYEKHTCLDCGKLTNERRYNSLGYIVYEYESYFGEDWWESEYEYDVLGRKIRIVTRDSNGWNSEENRYFYSRCEYTYDRYEWNNDGSESKPYSGSGDIHSMSGRWIEQSCTQYQTYAEICYNCGYSRYDDLVHPHGHDFVYVQDGDKVYYQCTRCGVKNDTGADGFFFMEDLTGKDGYAGFAVGFYNRQGLDLEEKVDFHVTVTTKDGETHNLDVDCIFYIVDYSGTIELYYYEYYEALSEIGIDSSNVTDVNFSFSVFDRESYTYLTHQLSVELGKIKK